MRRDRDRLIVLAVVGLLLVASHLAAQTGPIGGGAASILGGVIAGPFSGSLVLSTVAPHAIGTTPSATRQLNIGGTFAGGANGIRLSTRLQPASGVSAHGLFVDPTIDIFSSGTHADFTTANLSAPTITAGAGVVTTASTLRVAGPPTGASNNWAINSVSGDNFFGGGASVATTNIINASAVITNAPANFKDLNLMLTANGQTVYCPNCNIANPCTTGGTGALAKRLNGVFVCN